MLTLNQTASDTFQRANENPLSQGGNWTQYSTNALQVVSDLCETTLAGSEQIEIYSGTTLAANQYAAATISNMVFDTGGSDLFLYARLQANNSPANGYELFLQKGSSSSSFYLYSVVGSSPNFLTDGFITISNGDVWALATVGSTIYVLQNGTVVGQGTDATWASGSYSALGIQAPTALTDVQLSLYSIGTAALTTYSISGNAGTLAGATVSYSGSAVGNVTTTAGGAYTILGLATGTYTITPSLAGYTFSPTSQTKFSISSNLTGVNFTATASGNISVGWSPVDCRVAVHGFGPAANKGVVDEQGNVNYSLPGSQTPCNPAVPGTDSRVTKPTDCREGILTNSRTAPPFPD